jgi:DNA-binding NtrC family response regulator
MKPTPTVPALPQILVIDDQFGRYQLGDAFHRSVGDKVFSLFEADLANLCRNFGLVLPGTKTIPAGPVAQVVFSPAQRWNDEMKEIENLPELAVEAVKQRWPASDGSRWALVLLDLRFTVGRLNEYGDPARGTLFGADVLLPLLHREFGDDLPIVVLSSTSRDEMNQRIRELGALDFIQRVPGVGAPPEQSRKALKEALFQHGLMPDFTGGVVGKSLPVLKMLRLARRGGRSARTILLEGETGTGKGLLAQYIHSVSDRSDGPFEIFNAAQRTAELQADELFGHWQGAFTDARTDTPGIWERAQGGTLFIDEVADLDEDVQLRLMQPIEERRVRRLGHPSKGKASEIDVDVRVVLATNRTLDDMLSVKKDFLNRISAFVVHVPALRERREDIPALLDSMAARLAPAWNGRILPDAMKALVGSDWRGGNVRELRNVLERAITNNPGQDITARDLKLAPKGVSSAAAKERDPVGDTQPSPLTWLSVVTALETDPDDSTVADLRRMRRDLGGVLPRLLAGILSWSLRLTAKDGKPNHTAAVRFMLGRDDISTLEAKQFIRKYLNLDTRAGSVWRRFEDDPQHPQSALLDEILNSLRRRIDGSGDEPL